ncbi:MAG: type II toxin-antitoxin system RelE/ParE family toxin [Leptospirales bacterium]
MKGTLFHSEVVKYLRACDTEVRKKIGDLIFDLQLGKTLGPPESKPFTTIKKGVFELRLKEAGNAYRVFYYTKIKDSIIVFHMFQKKSNKTPLKEINTGRLRLKEIVEHLNEK